MVLLLVTLFACLQATWVYSNCFFEPDSSGHVELSGPIPEGGAGIASESFMDCYELKSIAIPDSITFIQERAFEGCDHLETVTFGSNSALNTIYKKAFFMCRKLANIVLPSALKVIKQQAFSDCDGLKYVIIPDSVTTIGREAFAGTKGKFGRTMMGYKSVTLGASLRGYDSNEPGIGQFAFASDSLESLTIRANSKNVYIASNAFEGTSHLNSSGVKFAKNVGNLHGLPPNLITFQASDIENEFVCSAGYGNGVIGQGQTEYYFSCIPCAEGTSSTSPLSQGACRACAKGKFSSRSGSDTCTDCVVGKYSEVVGAIDASVCKNCSQGMYSGRAGAKTCAECPPGNKCPHGGMAEYLSCPLGHYQERPKQHVCLSCPAGRYNNEVGVAACSTCDVGKYTDSIGANSSDSCVECAAGKYSNQNGSTSCTHCAKGQFQRETGQSSCLSCMEQYSKDSNGNSDPLTSTPDNTGCEIDASRIGQSMSDIMFEQGGALAGAFILAGGFVAIAMVMTYCREHDAERLANYTRFEALYTSFMAGFSVGSELLLLLGIWHQVPGLAIAMLMARLLHLIAGVSIILILFGSVSFITRWASMVQHVFKDARRVRSCIDDEFTTENMYLIEAITLLSFCDVVMLQFLPWKKSRFFVVSEGYPCLDLMWACMVVKTVQSSVSVVCEILFLALFSDAGSYTASLQARFLFYMNIVFGVITVVMDLLRLCMRGEVLARADEKERKEDALKGKLEEVAAVSGCSAVSGSSSAGGGDCYPSDGGSGSDSSGSGRKTISSSSERATVENEEEEQIEMYDIYIGDSGGGRGVDEDGQIRHSTDNPMLLSLRASEQL
jgi:hypothetical protein